MPVEQLHMSATDMRERYAGPDTFQPRFTRLLPYMHPTHTWWRHGRCGRFKVLQSARVPRSCAPFVCSPALPRPYEAAQHGCLGAQTASKTSPPAGGQTHSPPCPAAATVASSSAEGMLARSLQKHPTLTPTMPPSPHTLYKHIEMPTCRPAARASPRPAAATAASRSAESALARAAMAVAAASAAPARATAAARAPSSAASCASAAALPAESALQRPHVQSSCSEFMFRVQTIMYKYTALVLGRMSGGGE